MNLSNKIKEGLVMTHFPILSKAAINLCTSDYLKATGHDKNTLKELNSFACAKEILDRYGPFSSDHVVVYAGPGENGENGVSIALFLAPYTKKISICIPSLWSQQSDSLNTKQIVELHPNIEITKSPVVGDVYIDALFGIELDRNPDKIYREMISMLNQQMATVISIDIPSGIDADTTTCFGEAVKPDLTIAISCLKPIHCSATSRTICGEITCLNASIPRGFIEKYTEKQKLAC